MDGSTAMHFAAFGNHSEIIRILHAAGAHLNVQALGGSTPLHAAASGGAKKAAKVLLELGADDAVRNGEGLTARKLAKWDGHHFPGADSKRRVKGVRR
jgi:ankyrin repeat protein